MINSAKRIEKRRRKEEKILHKPESPLVYLAGSVDSNNLQSNLLTLRNKDILRADNAQSLPQMVVLHRFKGH